MDTNKTIEHIIFMGPCHPYRGGIASFTERLAKEFNAHNFKTELLTFSLQYPSILFPGKTQFSDSPAPTGLNISREINSINPFNWFRTGWKLKRNKPDLIIVRYWLPFMGPAFGTILRIAKWNNHTRVICIADNIIPHEKRIGDTLFTRYFSGAIDAFIAMSQQVLDDFKKLQIKQPVTLLHHPIFDHFGNKTETRVARNHFNLKDTDKVILFFGFIRHYKGLDVLLEAMLDPRIKNNGYKLLIAGEFYEDKSKYEALIQEFGIGDSIQIHDDFIPEKDITLYFSAADVLVQPYRHATQSGVTPLAYHFELPMIVTNVGGLTEMMLDGETGLIAEPNPRSIADQLVVFFEKGKESFIEPLVREKQKYTWDGMLKGIVDTYNAIK